MKARLLQLATVLLIGIAVAGCAGTGAGTASSGTGAGTAPSGTGAGFASSSQILQEPWLSSPSDMTN